MRRAMSLILFCAIATARTHASPRAQEARGGIERAQRILRAVFPAATWQKALRVVGCETGYSYDPAARNRSSGAFGWFQFMPGNHGRVISWHGMTLRIDYYRMANPWYASRAALILSQGGTNWREWACG